MRDIQRIPRTMELIEHYWLKVPDWRFGQLIENMKTFSGIDDWFFLEDDKIIEIFDTFFEASDNV